MAKKNAPICINLVSELSHLELLNCDPNSSQFIINADSEEFMFDPATRNMLDDVVRFKLILKRLYERNKIPLKTPTCLVLPSFFTRQYTLPSDILGEDVKTILTSEAERFYVFKKIDPEVGYSNLGDGKLLYTAYPHKALEEIKAAFSELKIPLISVDCNYTAILRGLTAMGVIQEEITNQLKWGMLVFSDYNMFMAIVDGVKIESVTESPLSLHTGEDSGLLQEISNDFQQFFGFEVLSRLIIVNNSLKLSSHQLLDNLAFQGPKQVYDQNEGTLQSRGAQGEGTYPCTLEAIGGTFVKMVGEVPPLELTDPEQAAKGISTDDKINLVSVGLLVLGVLVLILHFGLASMVGYLKDQTTAKTQTIQGEIQSKLAAMAMVPSVKQKLYVKQASFQNINVSNTVTKLGQTLPPDSWLKDVSITAHVNLKDTKITVNGGALTSDPLNTLVKELNTQVKDSSLTTSVVPKQLGSQQYFEFRISNSPLTAADSATAASGGTP